MGDEAYLSALRTYYRQNKAFPSMARLRDVVGLSSTSSVFALVNRLSAAGFLERVDGRVAPTSRFFARPLLGRVRAGLPQQSDQSPPEHLTLDDYLIDEPNRTSLHKVRGDSMHGRGLMDGDLVAVEHDSPAAPGDIVVAFVDGELTVKTLRRDNKGRFYLEAAHPDFPEIRPKPSLELLGVVVSLARRIRG